MHSNVALQRSERAAMFAPEFRGIAMRTRGESMRRLVAQALLTLDATSGNNGSGSGSGSGNVLSASGGGGGLNGAGAGGAGTPTGSLRRGHSVAKK